MNPKDTQELALVINSLSDTLSRMQSAETQYLSTTQISERLQISEDEVLRFTKAGMPYYEIGRGFKFLWPEVQAFVRKFRKEETFGNRERRAS